MSGLSRTLIGTASNALRPVRIRSACVADPRIQPHVVESGIRGLVLAMHGKHGIACIASCHGHGWTPWRTARNPYVYFHAAPGLAQALQRIFEAAYTAGLLCQQWGIEGIMHPDLGLSFVMRPFESRSLIGANRKNRSDLLILEKLVEHAVEERREFPPCDTESYEDERHNADVIVAAFVERVGIAAFGTSLAHRETAAQQFFALFARLKRHFGEDPTRHKTDRTRWRSAG